MTPLMVGMWHEMQPVAGLTGQIVACEASVNALPPLKWCCFWANPSLDEFSAQGPAPTPWTRMDPLVFSRLRRAAPGDLQRPCGCAWSGPTPRRGGETGRMVENISRRARSVDVFQQGRFLFPCQLLTSPLPKEPTQGYQGLAPLQASFTIIITRLLMPSRWLNRDVTWLIVVFVTYSL